MKGIISFYGKTGCKGNARQIEQLKRADYVVQVIDILTKEWDVETLLKFIATETVQACVNQRAPQISSGEFNPLELNDSELLQAMIQDPILIKRPLIFYRGEFACGFDHPLVKRLLNEEPIDYECQQHETCTHPRQ
jgi:nitrogenase-associated protein